MKDIENLIRFKAVELVPADSIYSEGSECLEACDSVGEHENSAKLYSDAKEVKLGVVSLLVMTPQVGTPELIVGNISEGDYA